MQQTDEAAVHSAPIWRSSGVADVEQLSVTAEYSNIILRAVFAGLVSPDAKDVKFDTCVTGSAASHDFAIHFSKSKAEAVLAKLIPGAFLGLDGNSRDLIFLTHLASPFLDAFDGLGLGPLQFEAVNKSLERGSGRHQVLNIEDKAGALRGQLVIEGNEALFASISAACASAKNSSVETGHLRSEIALVAGIVQISLADIRQLSAGQGVYLDFAPIENGRLLVSTGDGQFLPAIIDGTSAIITSEAPMKTPFDAPSFAPFGDPQDFNQMPNNGFVPNGAESGPIVSVQDIAVQMTVEVARYDLTVSEVGNLVAGSRFEISENPKKLVTLRIGHQVIGYGEIVQAGHKMAVRITEMKA